MKVHELFEETERSVTSVMGQQPEHIARDFFCSYDKLTSLKGAPISIDGNFNCSNNNLTSLKGGPTSVSGYYYCYENKLTSLEGLPSSMDSLSISNNKLTTLHNIHKIIKRMNGAANFSGNPIETHVLGLLLIDGLEKVWFDDNWPLVRIINKHLEGERDVFACQEELIENGFEEYAQL